MWDKIGLLAVIGYNWPIKILTIDFFNGKRILESAKVTSIIFIKNNTE
jgi:hypothetical protein